MSSQANLGESLRAIREEKKEKKVEEDEFF
jgi:hypothetical protein